MHFILTVLLANILFIKLGDGQSYRVNEWSEMMLRKLPPRLQKIKLQATPKDAMIQTTTVQSLPYTFQKLGNITSIRQLLMETGQGPMKSVGPVARITSNINTASLPCCRDRFGEQACQSLRKTQPAYFEKRCLSDHDFSSMDCCAECRKYIERNNISMDNAKSIQKAPALCRDKHSISFCRRFKAVGMGKFSCSNAEFAVRVCRHSCGYCNDDLYLSKNAPALCADSNKFVPPLVNGTELHWAFGRN